MTSATFPGLPSEPVTIQKGAAFRDVTPYSLVETTVCCLLTRLTTEPEDGCNTFSESPVRLKICQATQRRLPEEWSSSGMKRVFYAFSSSLDTHSNNKTKR
jgi:hypothetical protein